MILLTGGSGKLGTELQKHLEVYAPSHEKFDILRYEQRIDCDLIIHAAAYTKVEVAETQHFACFETNVLGTFNLVEQYRDVPFVFISTEYAHRPVNFYGTTKLIAEKLVKTHPHHLIIRTLFKPTPWAYEYAFNDQYTQGDYVDVIAKKIAKAIKEWDFKSKRIYVGTGRKTMFDLARQTKKDVKPNSIKDLNYKIPRDYV